jgi:hypothetical protein
MAMEVAYMALPKPNVDPTPEQRRHLDVFLAELAPAVPTGVHVAPSWQSEYGAWILWVEGVGHTSLSAYRLFVEASNDLADKHGVEVTLAPIEAKHLDG